MSWSPLFFFLIKLVGSLLALHNTLGFGKLLPSGRLFGFGYGLCARQGGGGSGQGGQWTSVAGGRRQLEEVVD